MIEQCRAEEWAKRIKHADWSYEYSDDYGAWNRGRGQCQAIIQDADKENFNLDDIRTIVNAFLDLSSSEREEYIKYYVDKIKYVFNVKDGEWY